MSAERSEGVRGLGVGRCAVYPAVGLMRMHDDTIKRRPGAQDIQRLRDRVMHSAASTENL